MTYERCNVRTSSTRLGDGSQPDVEVTMSRTLLNDLSALLLALPPDRFERWRDASDNIDRYLTGYDFKNDRLDR